MNHNTNSLHLLSDKQVRYKFTAKSVPTVKLVVVVVTSLGDVKEDL